MTLPPEGGKAAPGSAAVAQPAGAAQPAHGQQPPAGGAGAPANPNGGAGTGIPSLESLPAEIRPYVEEATRAEREGLRAKHQREQMELRREQEAFENDRIALDQYRTHARDPRVSSAIAAVMGKPEFVDPRFAALLSTDPGAAPAAPPALPDFNDPQATANYFRDLLRAEIGTAIPAALKPLSAQVQTRLGSFEQAQLNKDVDSLIERFPKAAAKRLDILNLSQRSGLPPVNAMYALMGAELARDAALGGAKERHAEAEGLESFFSLESGVPPANLGSAGDDKGKSLEDIMRDEANRRKRTPTAGR